MTKRRRLVWVAVTAGLALAVGLGFWLLRPPSRITDENCCRLTAGMTRSEVEAVLGGPPTGQQSSYLGPIAGPGWPAADYWCDNYAEIGVEFDERGRVVEAWFTPLREKRPLGFLDWFFPNRYHQPPPPGAL